MHNISIAELDKINLIYNDVTEIGNKFKNWPKSRTKHAACECNGYLYLFGGRDQNIPLRDTWRFNLTTLGAQSWEKLNLIGDKIPHLDGHTATAYKQYIYIFGGCYSNNALWKIDTTVLKCTSQDENVNYGFDSRYHISPKNRKDHTACIYKGHLYIFGGFVDLLGATNELWSFNLSNTSEPRWRLIYPKKSSGGNIFIPSTQTSLPSEYINDVKNGKMQDNKKDKHGPQCRFKHSCAVINGNLWVYGGEDNSKIFSDFWKWNFKESTWTSMGINGRCPLTHKQFHMTNFTHSSILFLNYTLNSGSGGSTGSSGDIDNKNCNVNSQVKISLYLLNLNNLNWEKPFHSFKLQQMKLPSEFIMIITKPTINDKNSHLKSTGDISTKLSHSNTGDDFKNIILSENSLRSGCNNPCFLSNSHWNLTNDNLTAAQSKHIEAANIFKKKTFFKKLYTNSREDLISNVNIEMCDLHGKTSEENLKNSENKRSAKNKSSYVNQCFNDLDRTKSKCSSFENLRIKVQHPLFKEKNISGSSHQEFILYLLGGRFKNQVDSNPLYLSSVKLFNT